MEAILVPFFLMILASILAVYFFTKEKSKDLAILFTLAGFTMFAIVLIVIFLFLKTKQLTGGL